MRHVINDDAADFWGDPEGDQANLTPVELDPVEIPKPPSGLKARGRRLFMDVVAEFTLAEHELAILIEAARTLDLVEQLQGVIRKEGPVVDSPQGRKAHPAAVEIRQQRIILARLIASLRIPLSDDQEAGRLPQRRTGVRSVKGA